MRNLNYMVWTIVMSILIFFSISFLTILHFLIRPIDKILGYRSLEIGFPLKYYEQFRIGCNTHHGWYLDNLLVDMIITVLGVSLIVYMRNRRYQRNMK